MAIGIYFSPAAMSAAKYDECIKLLRKAGAGNPAGRSYHAAFGPKDKLMVFDVWTSQAAFDKFGKTLMPILHVVVVSVLCSQRRRGDSHFWFLWTGRSDRNGRPRRLRQRLEKWLDTIGVMWPECPARISSDGHRLLIAPGTAVLASRAAHP
jgi:hypothetical protein